MSTQSSLTRHSPGLEMRYTGLLLMLVILVSFFTGATAGGYPSGYGRRALSETAGKLLCPKGLSACQIIGRGAEFWECVDTKQDLESCGGCMIQSLHPGFSKAVGIDCTAIRGVSDVSCVEGKCLVHRCLAGYKVDLTGNSCEEMEIGEHSALVLQSGGHAYNK